MFSFRINRDTNQVEILREGYVVLEMSRAEFTIFAFQAWAAVKNPTAIPRVRKIQLLGEI